MSYFLTFKINFVIGQLITHEMNKNNILELSGLVIVDHMFNAYLNFEGNAYFSENL